VFDPFATPDGAADLDRLADVRERGGEWHAVEPLDDLRPRRSESQFEAPTRHGIEPGCGHGEKCRCARIEGQDARRQRDRRGERGEVAESADGIEGVRLGNLDDVGTGPLECDNVRRDRREIV